MHHSMTTATPQTFEIQAFISLRQVFQFLKNQEASKSERDKFERIKKTKQQQPANNIRFGG